MQRGLRQYQNPSLHAASPQENEIVAFTLCNARLSDAGDSPRRIEALHKTHQLWSLIVKDVSLEGNRLPAGLKQQIATLGMWAMQYSISAMSRELPLDPLIGINQDMIDGLRAQMAGQAARAGSTAAPFSAQRAV